MGGGATAPSRPQRDADAPKDDGKNPSGPKSKSAAASDGEKPNLAQNPYPPHRLATPSDVKDEAAHNHSPKIPWPQDGQSASPRPFKNLK